MIRTSISYSIVEVWRYREASDNETGVDLSLMKADALRTLEEEIRLETDMMARYELDLLKTVRPLSYQKFCRLQRFVGKKSHVTSTKSHHGDLSVLF